MVRQRLRNTSVAVTQMLRIPFGGLRSFEDMAHMFNVVVEGAYLRRTTETTLGVLSDGSHISVQMIQMVLSQVAGQPWSQLAERTSIRP